MDTNGESSQLEQICVQAIKAQNDTAQPHQEPPLNGKAGLPSQDRGSQPQLGGDVILKLECMTDRQMKVCSQSLPKRILRIFRTFALGINLSSNDAQHLAVCLLGISLCGEGQPAWHNMEKLHMPAVWKTLYLRHCSGKLHSGSCKHVGQLGFQHLSIDIFMAVESSDSAGPVLHPSHVRS